MPWSISEDPEEFASEAGPFLRRRPARHTLELSILGTLRNRGPAAFGVNPPLFGWWRSLAGPVTAAFLQTPPYPLLLSSTPGEAAAELADTLASAGHELPGVNAEETAAGRFAARWHQRTSATASVHMHTRCTGWMAWCHLSLPRVGGPGRWWPPTATCSPPGSARSCVRWAR